MQSGTHTHVVVIDSGGTKIKSALLDQTGTLLDSLTIQESGYVKGNPQAVICTIASAVNSLLQRNRLAAQQVFVVAGIAGINGAAIANQAQQSLCRQIPGAHTRIVNDADLIGMASASQTTIVTICGTGSNTTGYYEGQPVCKCSGVNEILSDQGSGYWIGLQMLQATVKALDGRSQPSVLSEAVCQHFEATTPSSLQDALVACPAIKRSVAAISALLSPALIAQDLIAKQIADAAVEELYQSIDAVQAQLPLQPGESARVRFTGGVLAHNAYIFERLTRNLYNHANLTIDSAVTDAVTTGFLLAR